MAIIDFIDVIDDIIDLSSDEENVEQDHMADQPPVTMLDRHEVFVEAGDGRQEEVTWPTFKKERPLGTTTNQNSTPMTVPLPSPTSADPKANPSSQPDQIEKGPSTRSRNSMTGTTATPSSVVEKGPLDTTATQNFPPIAVPSPSPTSTTPNSLSFEGNDGKLLRMYGRRPRKKNYHTETPRRSPRLEGKHKRSKKES